MGLTYDSVVQAARAVGEGLVSVERDGAHAIVTLHDPEKLNPLSAELTVQLHDELVALAGDPAIRRSC
jgi:enoyl-CoA hydratase/carnithine racemase